MKKIRMKTAQGITLIALVVTIVILIILATITVQLIINGGLIGKASETKFKSRMTELKESVELYVAGEATKIENRLTDRTTVHAGEVLKAAINDKIVENITVEDVTYNIKDIMPDIKKDEEKYLVVYEGELYYVSSPNIKNNSQQEKWCIEIGIPILSYVPPTGIVVIDGSYEKVKDLWLCTPDLSSFVKEKTRYLEVGSNGSMQPGNWLTHYPKDTWYDYGASQWANVYVESEGKESYFVWIPRYCYKIAANQRTDVKLIDKNNSYKDKEDNVTQWSELEKEGYIVPDAFTFDGKALAGYWVSKYTVGEVGTETAGEEVIANTIEYDMSTTNKNITISNIKVKPSVTKNNAIVKYTVGLNGKIVQTIDKAEEVTNIGTQTITFSGLRVGNNTINLTGLNAKGEVVGSMTKEYEVSAANEPDLSGFNKEVTFYVEYDDAGNNIKNTNRPATKEAPEGWYDYESQKWANIVVRTEGVESYYTWIPRYEYKVADNQRTIVKFIPTTKTEASNGYTIPDAFTFDGKALAGYWVSKYTIGDGGADAFATEAVATRTTIKTKGITGSGTSTNGLVYHYYINGEYKGSKNTAGESFEYTGLTPDTQYVIMVEVKDSSGNYVGSCVKKVETIAANEPDLSGFSEEHTYYVVYDAAGENIVSQDIKVKKDLSNAPEGWYDYSSSKWANIVVKTEGSTTYYTWIPRYEYTIVSGQPAASARTTVKFIPTDKTTPSDGYTIPDAFTFNGKALAGYWVSKYTVGDQTYNP